MDLETREIPFTQYLLPDGRKRETGIQVDEDVYLKAKQFIDQGGCFECEILTTGHVSLTAVVDVPSGNNDVVIELVNNGPGVRKAVEKLVTRATARTVEEWIEKDKRDNPDDDDEPAF